MLKYIKIVDKEQKMISIDVKAETSTSSSSKTSKADEKAPLLSFSELLKGVSSKTDTPKVVQNGSLILALDTKQSKQSGSAIPNMTVIKNAKGALKESLLSSKESKIDIAVATVKVKKQDSLLSLLQPEAKVEINPKITNILSITEVKQLISDAKQYLKSKISKLQEYNNFTNKEFPKTLKGLATLAKKLHIDVSKITIEDVQIVKTTEDKKQIKESKIASIKTAPLFKAQNTKELSTEQIAQVKQIKVEHKTPKQKADETLKLLLSGEKAITSDTKLTTDFSVATARVIAPVVTKESTKSLEALLKGESSTSKQQNGEEITKLEATSLHKADNFEVKIKEAKQMIHYLSKDVKTAIEDYKAPFTRIKVQLNPQNLGNVELTVVQRGKNLHVQLSSNNAAINTLSMNANDLKTQLNNSGINNATLNFSNSSQDGSAMQQQNRQQSEQAHKEYNHFKKEEQNEEIISSLEIVVPHYA